MTAHVVPHILTGEILGPRDDVRVVASLHPLRLERVERPMPAGLSLSEMVERITAEPGCRSIASDFIVHVDGHSIAPANWHRVRPKPGTTVTMRPSLQGPFVPLFSAIAGAFSAFQGFIAGLGIFGKILMTGLSIGLKLLMNALFAPRPTKQEAPKVGYSFSGGRNQSAPFGPVPIILGKHRFLPFNGAGPYTETVGNDQYLNCLFVWGYGPLQIDDIKIGETPLSSFKDVQIETREGFADDEPTTLYPAQVLEEALNIKVTNEDDWQRRTTAENITYISLDFVAPNGIVRIGDEGNRNWRTVTIAVRYRPVDTETWTDLPDIVWKAKKQDTLRRGLRVDVETGQYDVEVWRRSADSDSSKISDTVYWTALRGGRPGRPIAFDKPLAVTAVRIKATSQLNGTLDTLNGVVTALIPSWDAASQTWVDDQPSRNPADHYRHVLQGPANARPRTDAEIDFASLQAWHEYCTAKGWTYDKPIVSAVSVYDQLLELCAAGRAMPVFRDGKWSVMWDEQDTPVVQMFTPRNSWGFEASHEFRDMPHGWRTKFINEKKKWVEDERIVYDDGYTAETATRFEGLEFPGVTNPDLIWKHGRFHLAQLRLRPETYTINVDFENLLCTRGDRVRVAHDVMLVGQTSGRVKSVDAGTQTIVVDEVVTFGNAAAYAVRFRKADGTLVLRSAVMASGETDTIQLDGTGDLPAAGDLFTFGESGKETAIYRVLAIEPLDDLAAKLTLVDNALGIYDADAGAVPEFDSNVTAPLDPYTLPPTDIRLTSSVYFVDDTPLVAVNLSWRQPFKGRVQTYEVEFSQTDDTGAAGIWQSGATVMAPLTAADVNGLDTGTYVFRVRAIFDDGTFSRWVETAAFSTDVILTAPPDVTDFKISTLGDLSTLTWAAVQAIGVGGYEIRFVSAESSTLAWNSATPLIQNVSGTNIQVPTMVGTYLIKAVSKTGVRSVNAAMIASNIAAISDMNVIETFVESPDFVGVKDGVSAAAGLLRLVTNNTTGIYYFDGSLDLGAVYTSRLSTLIEARGESLTNTMSTWSTLATVLRLDDTSPDDWNVDLQYRKSMVDPALGDWSDWQQLVVGDASARAFEFRLVLSGREVEGSDPPYSNVTPVVSSLKVMVDMPDRVVADNDIVVPTTGITIAFDPPFISLQGLATADQDMATGDRKEITAKGADGFTIRFFTAAGTPVARTIDYVAKGYGALQ
jgi:hypothetical protein